MSIRNSAKKCFDRLGVKLGIKKMEDWYDVTLESIQRWKDSLPYKNSLQWRYKASILNTVGLYGNSPNLLDIGRIPKPHTVF